MLWQHLNMPLKVSQRTIKMFDFKGFEISRAFHFVLNYQSWAIQQLTLTKFRPV